MYVVRVALPGYNAETDTNPDHFALYTDEDWVLIKEFGRGSTTVIIPNSVASIITHNFGYVPMWMDFTYEVISGGDPNIVLNKWKSSSMSVGLPGRVNASRPATSADVGHLRLGGTGTHKWFIFYDYEGT